jgi:hypothetical protein
VVLYWTTIRLSKKAVAAVSSAPMRDRIGASGRHSRGRTVEVARVKIRMQGGGRWRVPRKKIAPRQV